ncbi:ABC transporter ATP-binding protein, partial [Candidatus Bathyarchaeota archaeon]|nr:ABC transporter ATP-binding protein [Candidatus Bathyarchaeota archaeon]
MSNTTNRELLQVKNLKTYFFTSKGTVKAVDDVTVKVRQKEAVGLVGESGCGKTMTALSIMRLIPSPPGKTVGGEVVFSRSGMENIDLLSLTEDKMRKVRGRDISMVFQDPMTFLNPVLRIGAQITDVVRLHQRIDKKEAEKNVIETLGSVGIADPQRVIKYYPHQLSGGMRQRVLIAIAISCKPQLVILDEPTTALDVTVQAQVLELVNSLRNNIGVSILLISHDLGIIAEICDTLYMMYAGKIVESGDVFSMYDKCKHPYTRGLLKSALSIDEFKKELVTIEGVVPSLIDPPQGCRFHSRCPDAKAVCRKQ